MGESRFGWEERSKGCEKGEGRSVILTFSSSLSFLSVKPNGREESRLASYIPHNTFIFVGTEAEALKLQDHKFVGWEGDSLSE